MFLFPPADDNRRSIYRETQFVWLFFQTNIFSLKQFLSALNDIASMFFVESRPNRIRMQLANLPILSP
jgi:hypothetical protein